MKAAILMYHRVAETAAPDRYTVSPGEFRRQMQYLVAQKYQVIALQRLVRAFAGDFALPDRSIVITFDDGFLDTYENALPVLIALKMCATFYVISGLAGKTSSWMSSRTDRSTRLIDWREIGDLRHSGFEIGSHSVTHPRLTQLSIDAAKSEIVDSKASLEDRLGAPVTSFAYPYGDFDSSVKGLVRAAGYDSACSTLSGFVNEQNDLYALRRIESFGGDSLRVFSRKLKFGANEMSSSEVLRYYAKRAVARYFP